MAKTLLMYLNVLLTGCQILSDIHGNIGQFLNGYNDKIHAENIVLADWLPSVIDLYRPLATDKAIQIRCNIDNDKAFAFISDKLN